jgi:hypothetical protein
VWRLPAAYSTLRLITYGTPPSENCEKKYAALASRWSRKFLAVIPVHLGFGPTLACAIDSGELGLQGRESAIE